MPTRRRSNLRTILPTVKDHLVEFGVGTTDQINLAPDIDLTKYPPVIGDMDFFISLGSTSPEGKFDDGSARFDARSRTTINVMIRTGVVLDQVNDWEVLLCDEDLGILQAADSVIDALHDWMPEDSAGNELCFETMAWLGTISPPKEARGVSPGWWFMVVPFVLPVVLDLTDADDSDQNWRG
jgi:hypothetical protein